MTPAIPGGCNYYGDNSCESQFGVCVSGIGPDQCSWRPGRLYEKCLNENQSSFGFSFGFGI